MFLFTKHDHYELLSEKKDEFPFLISLARTAGNRHGVAWKIMHTICEKFLFSSGKSTAKFIFSLRVSISQAILMWCACICVLHGNFIVI